MASDTRDIERLVRDLGYTLVRNNGHPQYEHPDHAPLSLAASPSDRRWMANTMAELRRRHPELRPAKSDQETRERNRRRGKQRVSRSALSLAQAAPELEEPPVVEQVPNAGSPEAVAAGCTCPQFENNHGLGLEGQPGIFKELLSCPLHGDEPEDVPASPAVMCKGCGREVHRKPGPGRPRQYCRVCRPSQWAHMTPEQREASVARTREWYRRHMSNPERRAT